MRMMTYKEANVRLHKSLTPNNYCICYSTAIANDADPAQIARFSSTPNRLVPVDLVNIIQYTITYKIDNNTPYKSYTVDKYSNTPQPTNPTKDGWIFAGWSPSVSPIVTGPATYIAQWTPATVTINFVSDGTPAAQGPFTVTIGSDISSLWTTPTKEDYTFIGWNNNYNGTAPSSNTTYTAQWTSRYTIISDLGHGIDDIAEEGEPIREGTRELYIVPATKAQYHNGYGATTGAKSVTIYVEGYKYTNTENDSYNKTYDLDPNPVPFTGWIRLDNWGYTVTSASGVLGHNGGRYMITYSPSLVDLKWAPEDWFDDGADHTLIRIENADGSISYRLASQKGPAYDYDESDYTDARYGQIVKVAVNKNLPGVDPGVYYRITKAKIDPKYSAEKEDPVTGHNGMAGLTLSFKLFINLASV